MGAPLSASALAGVLEEGDKPSQETCQIVSGPRLELNRRDRLDHEGLARARGLRDDDRVLGWAHSEDQAPNLAEMQRKRQVTSVRQAAISPLVRVDRDQGIEKNLDAVLIQNKMHDNTKYNVKNAVVTLPGEVIS